MCGPGFRGVCVCVSECICISGSLKPACMSQLSFHHVGPGGGPLLGILQRLLFFAFLWTMKPIIIEMIIWLFYGF